jgi:hypothetical protein
LLTHRWSGMDSNVQFRCGLATVRGFVRVGADLPAHGHPSSCRPQRTDRFVGRGPGRRHSPPGSGGVTPRSRCRRCERAAELNVRIHSAPAVSQQNFGFLSRRRASQLVGVPGPEGPYLQLHHCSRRVQIIGWMPAWGATPDRRTRWRRRGRAPSRTCLASPLGKVAGGTSLDIWALSQQFGEIITLTRPMAL